MKTIEIISQDLFDKIRSRFTNLQMGDEAGGVTMDPRAARFYDFDFAIEGNNLGRVSISINELGTLKVFYGASLLEDSDPISKDYWYDFLREMRMFAKRRLLRFDTRDITKANLNKDDFQYLANNSSEDEDMSMNESVKFGGSKKTSYGNLQHAKVIVKHHKSIEDEAFGARKRANNIKAIYVQNEDGERFKYPFIHTAGAIAMAQHVAHGGKPYDDMGNHIIGISEQISKLSSCMKHMAVHDGMNQDAHSIAERVMSHLHQLKGKMKSLGGRNGYEAFAEEFEPIATTETEMDAATMENYKSTFTQKSFKEDLAQYFPLIHKIMQETNTVDLDDLVKETSGDETCEGCDQPMAECSCDDTKASAFEAFEAWADSVVEGTVEPDTLAALQELLASDLALGADGTSAIEALAGIGIQDEELAQALEQLAEMNPEADPKPTIGAWLSKVDPEAAQEFGFAPPASVAPPAPAAAADEDSLDGDAEEEEGGEKPGMRELAQWLGGHYNKHYKEEGFESPWRKGTTELATMASKEFGEEYGPIVEKMVGSMDETPLYRMHREHMHKKGQEHDAMYDENMAAPPRTGDEAQPGESPLDRMVRQYQERKAKGQEPDRRADAPEVVPNQTAAEPEIAESSDFTRIMKLAGLAK